MTDTDLLTPLRARNPLVHCITNYVAMNIAANVVLAAGASPAMVHAPEEMAEFTPISGALTINIGTLSSPWLQSMRAAAAIANEKGVPWVLDPVAHFISRYRQQAAQDLLAQRPTIVRGNASEIMALAGEAGTGKGADSGDPVEAAEDAARRLAQQFDTVVAVSGPEDLVTDGTRRVRLTGGSAIMPQVTALGCSQTALMGAYAAIGPAFEAAVHGMAHFKCAGTLAADKAQGPGSFAVHLLDALATVQPGDLQSVVRA